MSDTQAETEALLPWKNWLYRFFGIGGDVPPDPVVHCAQYRDKADGSCSHVDGPDCDVRTCSILRDYHFRADLDNSQHPHLGGIR